jgi:hypothetical protein
MLERPCLLRLLFDSGIVFGVFLRVVDDVGPGDEGDGLALVDTLGVGVRVQTRLGDAMKGEEDQFLEDGCDRMGEYHHLLL